MCGEPYWLTRGSSTRPLLTMYQPMAPAKRPLRRCRSLARALDRSFAHQEIPVRRTPPPIIRPSRDASTPPPECPEFVERHGVVDLAKLRRLLVLRKTFLPFGLGQRRDRSDHGCHSTIDRPECVSARHHRRRRRASRRPCCADEKPDRDLAAWRESIHRWNLAKKASHRVQCERGLYSNGPIAGAQSASARDAIRTATPLRRFRILDIRHYTTRSDRILIASAGAPPSAESISRRFRMEERSGGFITPSEP